MIGQSIARLVPPDCSDNESAILERIGRGESVESYETVRLCKDGARRDVTLTMSPIVGPRGEIVGASTIVHDITGRKRVEAALMRAKNDAERANTAKSRFLANMSHELRTPLNVIIGFAETMAQQKLGPIGNNRYHEYAADIGASGQHLLDLINDVLDLSKVEAGRYELRESPVSVTRLVEGCIRLLKGWPHDSARRSVPNCPIHCPCCIATSAPSSRSFSTCSPTRSNSRRRTAASRSSSSERPTVASI